MAQLVHCDLKTKHFLRFHGEWKLVDYGSVCDENAELLPPCTVRFAAPEVARARQNNSPLRLTPAVDVWGVALILYELFAGDHLLPSEQLEERTLAIQPELAVQQLDKTTRLGEQQRKLLRELLVVKADERCALREARAATPTPPPSPSPRTLARVVSPVISPALCDGKVLERSFFQFAENTEEAKHVEVLALFCSPRRRRRDGPVSIEPLQLMRDIEDLQKAVPRRMREIMPAVGLEAVADFVKHISPRVLHFSGHGMSEGGEGRLLFEDKNGVMQARAATHPGPRSDRVRRRATPPPPLASDDLPPPWQPVNAEEFIQLLRRGSCPRLEGVFLNACKTKPLGERIVEALPHLYVIVWDSVTRDEAAQAFGKGFYDALGRGCSAGSPKVSIEEAYRAGEEAFAEGGWGWGDPRDPAYSAVCSRPRLAARRTNPPYKPDGAYELLKKVEVQQLKRRSSVPALPTRESGSLGKELRRNGDGTLKPNRVRSR